MSLSPLAFLAFAGAKHRAAAARVAVFGGLAGLTTLASALAGCGNSARDTARLDRDRSFLEAPLNTLRSDDRQTDLMPLSPGNYWLMRTVTRNRHFQDRITVASTTEKTPGSAQAGTLLDITREGKPWRREIYVPDSNQILLAGAKDETSPMMTFSPPIPLIRHPFTEGQTWGWQGDIHLQDKSYPGKAYSRLSTVEQVVTPAGKFRAYRIDTILMLESGSEEIRFPSVRWLAPGVGWVRRGFADQGQPAFSELQEFHVR